MDKTKNIKQSLTKILDVLGFKSIKDTITIVPLDVFDTLNEQLVFLLAKEYKLNMTLDNLSSERKLEIVNRVLELFHGMIIDSVKELDSLYVSEYKLEQMIVC